MPESTLERTCIRYEFQGLDFVRTRIQDDRTYWILVLLGFWHIKMVPEPRSLPPPIREASGDFLSWLFCLERTYCGE